ncbi:hypothetical protein Metbo_2299 [Methanobacterium lacus]|uniref:Uncharacterized protein n=1 Tax=Methanobacterium lacus (strain AL-21) TaxID=877455 RepID=F0T606_METLA|nr:hypothetical protein [Methanobacterium lacus]ADZ10513.1 hypothetical protein Metbo_2299 [Methanobacterium lacus]
METTKLTRITDLMTNFAVNTGLDPEFSSPVRYLWTDAFAVCNYMGLYNLTGDTHYLDLGTKLINQVHQVLGKLRDKSGWISGLDKKTGEKHPTIGGLRIGKKMDEREQNQEYDEILEWEMDGQYYHYITKWIHALNITAKVSGDTKYLQWAGELLKTAHDAFTYSPAPNIPSRLYWKMSVDLKRPLVSSMGQQDPMDGYVTYKETETISSMFDGQRYEREINEISTICKKMDLKTNDPLGIGGLLTDATRTTQLMVYGSIKRPEILENLLNSALLGIKSYKETGQLALNPEHRLAFRELGLSIGFKGLDLMERCIENNPEIFISTHLKQLKQLQNYRYMVRYIDEFWLDPKNQYSMNWKEHRDINTVMLATAMYPDGFLII